MRTHGRSSSRFARITAGAAALTLTVGALAGATPAAAAATPDLDVIVRTAGPGDAAAARALVARAGGTVGSSLDVISGFTARVPAAAVPALRRAPGIAGVTADGTVRMKAFGGGGGGSGGGGGGGYSGGGGGGGYSSGLGSSLFGDDDDDNGWGYDSWGDSSWGSWRNETGSSTPTGKGIGVALIDSGVAPVRGLDRAGKVIKGPDLSFESQTPSLRNVDTYGHGTHMAGIIAGNDPATSGSTPRFDGIAPGAHLVSLKVAAEDGATDVSQVLAAIDWVVQHRNDTGLNIRVLNLSFGTDSIQAASLDPLSFAVEAAWRKGIVVVVAVGNDGAAATRVRMPAANPYVIAVGAADSKGTTSRLDDSVADFSTKGSANRHADLLASGRSVVSLRAPGSKVDNENPAARVADKNGTQRLFRGSGTSQAAAVVSGSVALLLEKRPTLTPDQIKKVLVDSADRVSGDSTAAGAGQLDIGGATLLSTLNNTSVGSLTATQRHTAATGMGSLELSRGTAHVVNPETAQELVGERDIFGNPWVPAKWTVASRNGTAWTGGSWNGSVWAGTSFLSGIWAAVTWTGRSWTGALWSGRSWTNVTWSGRSWTGRIW
ncbi:hypothetical protein GCM10010123_05590 [Pilimelia anulata]|uniref:Peptidase S8/S53 domain-containing protein n=1 Tax=Pilimelia anulata TaxID=53371 RepID=A0A8J3B6R9_9ACTN|nr:S8 family serine peptidase [Pilimelia anulata]GGJ78510.1 hypothetical protein GCM10010123_05590 [Pilimelia anulata]